MAYLVCPNFSSTVLAIYSLGVYISVWYNELLNMKEKEMDEASERLHGYIVL